MTSPPTLPAPRRNRSRGEVQDDVDYRSGAEAAMLDNGMSVRDIAGSTQMNREKIHAIRNRWK